MSPSPSPSVSAHRVHRARRALVAAVAGLLAAAGLWAICFDASDGPDVIVADLYGSWANHVTTALPIDGQRAYSIGTKSLNIGDTNLLWQAGTTNHPVIGQHLYRYQTDAARPGGRLEQIGLAWLKHGFNALAQNEFCSVASGNGDGCDNPGTGSLLGTGCSDPYDAATNGENSTQGTACSGPGGPGALGARSEVNAATGQITYPYQLCGTGDATLRKRLRVADADVDPAANPGARYFAEAQYVTPDDAAAGHAWNNASFREAVITNATSRSFGWGGALGAATTQQSPALAAWVLIDPSVAFAFADVAADGRFHLAAKVHDFGDGSWRYEYAVHNLTSHRSLQRFEVPVPAGSTVDAPGFHDVDYHSGEVYSNTDWTIEADAPNGFVAWFGATHAANPNANALRWGTTYNFWFDSDQAPGGGRVELTLFRPAAPGAPTTFSVNLPVPGGALLFADDWENGTASAWDFRVP